MSPGVLYISYDRKLEPLGQSQVLAYLERLAVDRPIHLLSFDKPDTSSENLAGVRFSPLFRDLRAEMHA